MFVFSRVANTMKARIRTNLIEAKSVIEKLPGLGQGSRSVGTGLAERVREGGEAEARRAVGSFLIRQFAILHAVCCSSLVGRVVYDDRSSEAR